MKTNLLLAMLCLGTSAAFAQRANQEPLVTKPLAGLNIREVFVNTSGGSITVAGTDDRETRVEMYVNSNNNSEPLSKEEAQKRIDKDYIITLDAHDGELHASAKQKGQFRINWNNNGLSISFKVYVPVKTATHLNTSGGSIRLSNLTGQAQFSTSGGSLNVDHLAGVIKGETSGGSIHVSDSNQDIDLRTSGGSIAAENCQGNIRLETSGGSLRLTALKGSIKANTSGGSITGNNIKGELITGTSGGSINLTELDGSLDASTSAGSLHASFIQVGKYVKLDVSAGHIDLGLPAKQGLDLDIRANNISKANLSNFTGDTDREHLRGKINGGGSLVRADAGSGRVNLTFN